MTVRALLLVDGSSDRPLSGHLEQMCLRYRVVVDVVPLPLDRLPREPGLRVDQRTRAALAIDPHFDWIFVHRDAEGQDPELRRREVEQGVRSAGFSAPAAAVVPVRMTEAWLLLDERAIRRVAGHPAGQEDLGLPAVSEVESVPRPKATLQAALERAAGVRGRRLEILRSQFGEMRRQLLERLQVDGPVTRLSAWRRLDSDIRRLCK